MAKQLNPFQIAVTQIPGLGPKSLRQLFDVCDSPEKLFSMSHAQLKEIFPRHPAIVSHIESKSTLLKAEKELPRLENFGIDTVFYTEADYPRRLNQSGCEDTPVLLYRLGTCDLNPHHSVAMVGSRKCTDYGRTTTFRLAQEMASDKPLIVSGLAYGIDTAAHTAALDNAIPTVAVLGHGLDTIYPTQNRALAKRILDQGGALLTEYPLDTEIQPSYFPARNRIVAALSDATVVVESAERGGALITANIANSYHREVFAVPGRLGDPLSDGCNNLIVNNKAIMLRNAGDLYFQMGWKNAMIKDRHKEEQQELFASLNENEQTLANLLRDNREMTMDEMSQKCTLSLPKIASILMELELKKVIRCLPGRIYKLS